MKFFISSTYCDLIEVREGTIKYLHELTCDIEAMEFWSASNNLPKSECLKRVAQSDLVICILGCRYGSIDIETNKSITELEIQEAYKNNIPILFFIMGEKYDNHIQAREDRMEELVSRILAESGKTCAFFSSLVDFVKKLNLSITDYFKEIEGFSYDSIWGILAEVDFEREPNDLAMESFRELSTGEVFEELESNINACFKVDNFFCEYYQHVRAVIGMGPFEDEDGIEGLQEHSRKMWDYFIMSPNRFSKMKMIYYRLKLEWLQSRLLHEVWTNELRKEILNFRDEYKEYIKKAFYID